MRKLAFLMMAALTMTGLALQAEPARAEGEVYVVGALQRLHATEPGFGYAHLRRILDAARPDVVVLEVRPDELAARGETPGRPEYPQVVWPYLRNHPVAAAPMEPGGEAFARMSGAAGAAIETMERDAPEAAKAWSRMQVSTDAALQAYWRHPADAHDAVTADVVQASADRQAALAGGAYAAAQAEWDGYMADRAREAVLAHPGKRVLILASYRNRHLIEAAVRAAAPGRVVDMPGWLKTAVAAQPAE
jgi:hypothetical protein